MRKYKLPCCVAARSILLLGTSPPATSSAELILCCGTPGFVSTTLVAHVVRHITRPHPRPNSLTAPSYTHNLSLARKRHVYSCQPRRASPDFPRRRTSTR